MILILNIIAVNKKGSKLYEDENNVKYAECHECMKDGKPYIKPITEFHKNTQNILGVRSYCKQCHNVKSRKRNKRWNELNREKSLESKRRWWYQNSKRWRVKNPDKVQKKVKQRKLRERLASNAIPLKDKAKLLKLYDYSCALTGTKNDIQIDHIIPLTTGHSSNNFDNILPLNKSLNASKSDRNIFEWAIETHEFFGFKLEHFYEVMTEVASRSEMNLFEYKNYVTWCHKNR